MNQPLKKITPTRNGLQQIKTGKSYTELAYEDYYRLIRPLEKR